MTDFEKIAVSVPSNATAARVVAKGEHYDRQLKPGGPLHLQAPPAMAPTPAAYRDIPGTRFGRFTVIGKAADTNPKKPALWIVRCACGDYEMRRLKSIRNPLNADDRCRICRDTAFLQRRYRELGPRNLSEFTATGAREAPRDTEERTVKVDTPPNRSASALHVLGRVGSARADTGGREDAALSDHEQNHGRGEARCPATGRLMTQRPAAVKTVVEALDRTMADLGELRAAMASLLINMSDDPASSAAGARNETDERPGKVENP